MKTLHLVLKRKEFPDAEQMGWQQKVPLQTHLSWMLALTENLHSQKDK